MIDKALLLTAFVIGFDVIYGDMFVAYGDSSKIFIRNVVTGALAKTFNIREYQYIHVSLHYKQDLIIYASDKKLYKIYLLDDNGNRKISGKGELFTDPNADHFEVFMGTEAYNIRGLSIDEDRNKLYISVYDKIFERNLDGSQSVLMVGGASIDSGPVFLDRSLYFSVSNPNSGVYRVKLGENQTTGPIEELVAQGSQDIFSLDVCPYSKKLFYRRGSSIQVIDTNLTASSYPISNAKVVLSDSQFTGGRGLLPIAVRGRYLVFANKGSSYGQLYMGFLNSALNFISKKNIYVYGKPSYGFRPYKLAIFEHQFPVSTKPTTSPAKLCPCPGT